MKTETRSLLTALVAVGGFLLAGCSTGPHDRQAEFVDSMPSGDVMSNPMTARTRADAPVIGVGTSHPPRTVPTDQSTIAFNTPGPGAPTASTAGSTPRTTDRDHTTALIGLYGELVGNTRDAGAQLDGASNLTQVSFATEGSCIDPDIDHSGAMMVFASTMHRPTSDIYIKSVNGKTCTQLTADPADDVMPCFSPDAKNIAFSSRRNGNWDIFTVTITGGRPVQITGDNDPELHPTWSPDGKMLAYCKFGSQSARWEIWTIEVANPSAPHFLEYGVFPKWNPDLACNKILFQRAKQRGSREYSIWTIDHINGQAMNPTEIVSAANAALINPAWSADGSRIVFVSVIEPETDAGAAPSQSDLWVVNLDGTNRTNLTNGQFANYQPVWAGDGTVYFVSNRSGVDNIWAVTTTTTRTIDAPATEQTGIVNAEAQNQPADSPQ